MTAIVGAGRKRVLRLSYSQLTRTRTFAGQTGDSKISESQITSLPMRHIFALLKALLHERAALRAGEMGVIPAGRPHELAHLLKS